MKNKAAHLTEKQKKKRFTLIVIIMVVTVGTIKTVLYLHEPSVQRLLFDLAILIPACGFVLWRAWKLFW